MHDDNDQPLIYNAVIVLGANIRLVEGVYKPSTYEDHDQYGMLAGEMTVLASTILYMQRATDTFVFSTGVSQKNLVTFGPRVPTEAKVYSRDFAERISSTSQPMPHVILEDRSVNTYSNITECIAVMNKYQWNHVAILCARYHVPRVQALWKLATRQLVVATSTDFLSSEDLIEQNMPGVYDDIIKAAYNSPEGKKRLRSEAQGLQDMRDGKYVVTEFQLKQ